MAAAVSTLVTYAALLVMYGYLSVVILPAKLDVLRIAKILASSLLMGLIIAFIEPEGLLNLLVVVGFGVLVYFGTLFALKGVTVEDIKYLMRSVKGE